MTSRCQRKWMFFASASFSIFLHKDISLCIISLLTSLSENGLTLSVAASGNFCIISIEVMNPCEPRINPPSPPTHGAPTLRVCSAEQMCGCSGEAQVGIPVRGQEGGPGTAHVFTYVDRCVTLNSLQTVRYRV